MYVKPQRSIGCRWPAHVQAKILQEILARIIPAFAQGSQPARRDHAQIQPYISA